MRTTTRSPRAAAVLVAVAAALPGCGGATDGFDREPVSGSVTLDGRPIAGDITFIPTGNGPSTGAHIAEGTYAIDRSIGPAPGLYRVEIVSIRPTGRTIPDRDGPPGSGTEEKTNAVPGRYNVDSRLKAQITRGGPNTFDFPITSTPDRPAKKRR